MQFSIFVLQCDASDPAAISLVVSFTSTLLGLSHMNVFHFIIIILIAVFDYLLRIGLSSITNLIKIPVSASFQKVRI